MLFNYKKCSNCERYYDPTLNECPDCHKDNELYVQRAVPKSVAFFHPVAQIGLFLTGFAYAGMVISEIFVALFLTFIDDNLLKRTILLAGSYFLMFIGLLLIVLLTRKNYFFSKFKNPFDYLFGFAYAGGIVVTTLIISLIVNIFYSGGDNANQAAAIELSQNYPLITSIVLCLLGPICEEMTYRVGLYSFLRRINKYLAMAVTVIVFAMIHFDFESPDIINELWSLPTYLACGVILTVAYEHRGPACSIAAHVIYNTFAFIMILIGK